SPAHRITPLKKHGRAVPNRDKRRMRTGQGRSMKHPSIRELFDYWNAQRGPRPAPERSDIEPGAIRRVLADTFILCCEPRARHSFRIAGPRVCAMFGRDLKGQAFLDLWSIGCRKDVRELLSIVSEESAGVVASVSGTSIAGATLGLELVLLPLTFHGRTDARFLGALAPGEAPPWLGISTLTSLTLGSYRFVGLDVTRPAAPRARGRAPPGRPVHRGFTA